MQVCKSSQTSASALSYSSEICKASAKRSTRRRVRRVTPRLTHLWREEELQRSLLKVELDEKGNVTGEGSGFGKVGEILQGEGEGYLLLEDDGDADVLVGRDGLGLLGGLTGSVHLSRDSQEGGKPTLALPLAALRFFGRSSSSTSSSVICQRESDT
jgi:hypothetical protein